MKWWGLRFCKCCNIKVSLVVTCTVFFPPLTIRYNPVRNGYVCSVLDSGFLSWGPSNTCVVLYFWCQVKFGILSGLRCRTLLCGNTFCCFMCWCCANMQHQNNRNNNSYCCYDTLLCWGVLWMVHTPLLRLLCLVSYLLGVKLDELLFTTTINLFAWAIDASTSYVLLLLLFCVDCIFLELFEMEPGLLVWWSWPPLFKFCCKIYWL